MKELNEVVLSAKNIIKNYGDLEVKKYSKKITP